ncbi:microprocessor complex subunit DGCR8 isoform X2 [Pieris napi]|nr:microprocessor complex subunit DGCR8 isoform X2 [Pieris napi]XP_047511238.1 microprocessor complex subunit DGCR8 isoform X2 [Pieris napi]XP_047511239.1 microprocessor complex subunit DGCR8 isoform X2 [Pieris napi]
MSDSEIPPPPKKSKVMVEKEEDFTEDPGTSTNEFVVDDKYNNYVTPEELQKLKEFKILDEVKSDDEEAGSDGGESDVSQELPEEEIEKMLEDDLPDDFKGAPKPKEKPYILRSKIVMEEKGTNPFEVLPLDWICARHLSGIPVYMHRPTRVVTLAKPYCLGKSNIQRHDIPISAIPCLAYRRALEEEEKQKELDKKIQEQVDICNAKLQSDKDSPSSHASGTADRAEDDPVAEAPVGDDEKDNDTVAGCPFKGIIIKDEPESQEKDKESEESLKIRPVIVPGGRAVPPPRVEAVSSSWRTQHLTPEHITRYCEALFHFKTVQVMHFNRWADRRKYTKARKALQYPSLPEGTKLITIPTTGQDGVRGKRDWVMNMNGRCYLSVFHEYVNRALQQQPAYHFTQLENAATPYQATVFIGDMQYGVGVGSSKRQAKAAAARASIRILIPEMKDELAAPDAPEPDFSFFDYVGVEDPRVAEFCVATCEPSPHAILRTCLLRNFGAGDRHIDVTVDKLEYQKIQLTMKVGKHSAVVVCNNKKAAKQRASQAILQSLHPHVRSWGSLLRLYGSRSVPSCAERKLHEQQITLLQEQARRHRPNRAVLSKLRQDMLRLEERDRALAPVGTLLLRPADALPQHSGSNLNNLHL